MHAESTARVRVLHLWHRLLSLPLLPPLLSRAFPWTSSMTPDLADTSPWLLVPATAVHGDQDRRPTSTASPRLCRCRLALIADDRVRPQLNNCPPDSTDPAALASYHGGAINGHCRRARFGKPRNRHRRRLEHTSVEHESQLAHRWAVAYSRSLPTSHRPGNHRNDAALHQPETLPPSSPRARHRPSSPSHPAHQESNCKSAPPPPTPPTAATDLNHRSKCRHRRFFVGKHRNRLPGAIKGPRARTFPIHLSHPSL